MSVSINIFIGEQSLPSSKEIELLAKQIEPSFSFSEYYEFNSDTGYCPCILYGEKCGIEWEINECDGIDDEKLKTFYRFASLSFRSSEIDGVCAVILAASITSLMQGIIEEWDGKIIEVPNVMAWAKKISKDYLEAQRSKENAKELEPKELLSMWLDELKTSSVRSLVRSFPDDPYISIVFETNKRLAGSFWSCELKSGDIYSTQNLSRTLSSSQIKHLENGIRELTVLLKKWHLKEIIYDSVHLELKIILNDATIIFYPQSSNSSLVNSYFAKAGGWSIADNRIMISIKPDLEISQLKFG